MKKILAFAGSNSSTSINHALVENIASKLDDSEVTVIKLDNYELPIYGEDLEKDQGFPEPLERLLQEVKAADGLIISVNEHNGSVSAFFKNVLDWLSRIEYKFLAEKKVLLMSASPGKRGALSAYEYTKGVLPRYGAEVMDGVNFPSFPQNYSEEEKKITNDGLESDISNAIDAFAAAV